VPIGSPWVGRLDELVRRWRPEEAPGCNRIWHQLRSMVMGIVKAVRWTAYVEATLFILLLIAVVIQATGHGSLAATIVGSMHGTVFTFYIVLVLVARFKVKWRWSTTAAILLIACVPGGGYVVDRYAFRYEPRAKRPGTDAGAEGGSSAGAGSGSGQEQGAVEPTAVDQG
jgi:integral membrane protein